MSVIALQIQAWMDWSAFSLFFFALNTFENNTTLDTQKIENKLQKGVNN